MCLSAEGLRDISTGMRFGLSLERKYVSRSARRSHIPSWAYRADAKAEQTKSPYLKIVSSDPDVLEIDKGNRTFIGKKPGHVEIRISFSEARAVAQAVVRESNGNRWGSADGPLCEGSGSGENRSRKTTGSRCPPMIYRKAGKDWTIRRLLREARGKLVIRGDPLNVVDHQRLDLRLPLFKLQTERFANGFE